MHDFSKSQIAVLGAGKMGGILVKALIEKHQLSPNKIRATVGHESRARDLSHKLGVVVTTDNVSAVDGADVIFICVKPQVVQELTEQIADKVTAKQLVVLPIQKGDNIEIHLAWEVTAGRSLSWTVYVDAISGDELRVAQNFQT